MSNKINSIFYFPESLTFENYLSQLNSGSIAERTIVFAKAQKSIYMGGRQYGAADTTTLKELLKEILNDPEIINKITNIFNNSEDPDLINKIENLVKQYYKNNPQELPKASKYQYGVVKVGTGIDVSSDGVISVDGSNIPNINGEPAAYVKGVSKSGNTLTFTNKDNSTLSYTPDTSGTGEPSEYLKDASASGNTLTITKKNGSTVTFTPSSGSEPSQYIKSASTSGNTLTLTPKSGSAITFTPTGGGSEPSEYIKSASKSGNTLTLTKKDNSTFTFTPTVEGTEPASYIKSATTSSDGNTLTLTPKSGSAIVFSPSTGGSSGEPSAYLKSASVSSDGKTLTIVPKTGNPIDFAPAGTEGSSTLAGLTDVQFSSLSNGQSLVYNGSTGKWINSSSTGQGNISVDADAEVDGTTGTPHVTVTNTGTASAPVFMFSFTGLKGEKGDTGAQGELGPQGPLGPQGIPGSSGEGGEPVYVENPFDPTDINTAIAALQLALADANSVADREKTRLDNLIDGLDDDIKDKVENMFEDAQWIQENFPMDEIWGNSNFGISGKVEQYLQTIGLWTQDDQGNTVTQWSKISQTVNSLTTTVAALLVQAGDTSAITALQSSLEQYVDTELGTATTNIGNTYVKMSDMGEILNWMWSGLKSQSGETYSYSDVLAAAKNQAGHKAISDLHTAIQAVGDDRYVATSSLTSMVDDAISGIANDVWNNYASTTIFSKIDENSDNIAAIVTKITGDTSSAAVATKINNFEAGLITTSNLDSSLASLLATSGTTMAGLVTKSELDNAKTEIQTRLSSVESDTQYISGLRTEVGKLKNNEYFTSATLASVIAGMDDSTFAQVFAGLATTAELNQAKTQLTANLEGVQASITNVVKHNGSGKITSEITLDADQINLTGGNTFILNLTSNSAFIAALRTIDLGASHSVIVGDSGKFGIGIQANSGTGYIDAGILSGTTISNPTFSLYAGERYAILDMTGLIGEKTSIYGGHIDCSYNDDSLSLSPDAIHIGEHVSIWNTTSGGGSGFIKLVNDVGTSSYILANGEYIIVQRGDNTVIVGMAATGPIVSVTASNGAYTRIEAGNIQISDGNGNTKLITATN